MRKASMYIFAVRTAFLATSIFAAAGIAGANASPAAEGRSPSESTQHELFAVSADSETDARALGDVGYANHQTLILHWNGRSWKRVPIDVPGGVASFLSDLVALSPRDVWVVGAAPGRGSKNHALIEHWDGQQFSVVPVPPTVGSGSTELASLSARSSTDIWAGGYTSGAALVEHWNGIRWRVVPGPSDPDQVRFVCGLLALSDEDVWATDTGWAHWDGAAWAGGDFGGGTACGLAATSPDDVWAGAGSGGDSGQIFHWDGTG